MLDLAPNDPLIKTYLKDLHHLQAQSVTRESGLRGPFQTLLDKAAKKRGWTLVPELSTYSGGKRVVPDGTVRDEFRLARGWLARLHVEYESLPPWPLREIETAGVPHSQRVEKMKLSADKRSLQVNPSLTLDGIPPEAFEYRLGSQSALEWVVDQYQVKGESDPNREDDPAYIVRLVGQVVRVRVDTVRIVKSLPNYQ